MNNVAQKRRKLIPILECPHLSMGEMLPWIGFGAVVCTCSDCGGSFNYPAPWIEGYEEEDWQDYTGVVPSKEDVANSMSI